MKKTTKPTKKKLISFRTEASLHRLLRMRAAKDGVTIERVAADALERHLIEATP